MSSQPASVAWVELTAMYGQHYLPHNTLVEIRTEYILLVFKGYRTGDLGCQHGRSSPGKFY